MGEDEEVEEGGGDMRITVIVPQNTIRPAFPHEYVWRDEAWRPAAMEDRAYYPIGHATEIEVPEGAVAIRPAAFYPDGLFTWMSYNIPLPQPKPVRCRWYFVNFLGFRLETSEKYTEQEISQCGVVGGDGWKPVPGTEE